MEQKIPTGGIVAVIALLGIAAVGVSIYAAVQDARSKALLAEAASFGAQTDLEIAKDDTPENQRARQKGNAATYNEAVVQATEEYDGYAKKTGWAFLHPRARWIEKRADEIYNNIA